MSYLRSRTGAPDPEGTGSFPDWVMLDRLGRTICHDADSTAREAVKNYKSTAVQVQTSSGHSGYFSFKFEDPPKPSYLDLHWKSAFPTAYPSVLATDKNLALLCIDIPTNYIPSDLFVYEAGPSPSLLRLPPYLTSARGLAGRTDFLVDNSSIGILRRADHYLVADLIVSPAATRGGRNDDDDSNVPMMTKLCVYYSKKKTWQVSTQTAPSPRGQGNSTSKFPIYWSNHHVVAFDGRFLCWVDYFSGVLLCDFSNRRYPMLHFLPFPGGKHYSDEVRVSKCYPDRYRTVSVSQGMICFVHIDNDWHEAVSPVSHEMDEDRDACYEGAKSGSKITIWNLSADFNWEKLSVIDLDSLWKQPKYKNLCIAPRLPEFPVLSVDHPDVLYCLLREAEFHGTPWMIMLCGSKLQSCTRYVNENVSYITDEYVEERRNSFSDTALHATVFPKYMKNGQEVSRSSY
jgi:hypothetical protein